MTNVRQDESVAGALIIGPPALERQVATALGNWTLECLTDTDEIVKASKANEKAFSLVIVSSKAWQSGQFAQAMSMLKGSTAILGIISGNNEAEPDFVNHCDATVSGRRVPTALIDIAQALLTTTAARRQIQLNEDEMRMLRQRVRVLDQVSQAIIGADLTGRIKAWNKRAESIFGYTREEVLGHPLKFIFDQDPTNSFHLHKVL
ncbi:MAG: PAS domain S-box protein, partial [Puniceicoccales bacterium]